ncbi:hypothetical protein [Pseudaminobacter soli (ex Li et al. 2025)]|uniref:Morphogenetic protein n=1 Tax=Pseudaminobacter soli (ex Li et al. 2025) TaxID=1295366 RepID=A0A2P7SE73_9HYPH|nr:hypothetical protein [Mesorhizobium soli]PSJ60799.1 hypothetical protein C7I85_12210 [Mesorhizobium soli]
MTDRPILFSSPMVRALLDGRKTQTRRVIGTFHDFDPLQDLIRFFDANDKFIGNNDGPPAEECRKYEEPSVRFAVGDRLWVREVFSYESLDVDRNGFMPPWYWADGNPSSGDFTKPKPSIHMPRWASRLTLTVTDVRVQRLQEISEADARAEGCPVSWDGKPYDPPHPEVDSWQGYGRASFCLLWNKLNAPRGFGWYANPWVVAVSFTVEHRNIDALEVAA